MIQGIFRDMIKFNSFKNLALLQWNVPASLARLVEWRRMLGGSKHIMDCWQWLLAGRVARLRSIIVGYVKGWSSDFTPPPLSNKGYPGRGGLFARRNLDQIPNKSRSFSSFFLGINFVYNIILFLYQFQSFSFIICFFLL